MNGIGAGERSRRRSRVSGAALDQRHMLVQDGDEVLDATTSH
jgi:hypothetical protein